MLAKRIKTYALLAALGGLGLVSCGEKETGEPVEEKVEEVAAKVAEVVEPIVAKASPADRAAALGFAKYLPAETEAFLGLYDGAGFVQELRESKIGKFVEKMAMQEGVDLDEINQSPQAMMGLSLLKEEFFFTVGTGTDTQTKNLLSIQQLNNYYQMKAVVSMAAAGLKGEDFNDDQVMMDSYGHLFRDPKVTGAILESAQMPPIMLGCKISDEEMRMQLSGMTAGGLAEFLSMAGPEGENVAEAVQIENGETPFTGVRLVGEKVVAKMKEEGAVEALSEFLDPATVEKILAQLAKKDLVVATGTVDEYLVIFLGSDASEFKLAESPEKSYVSNSQLAFVDSYLSKKLMMVMTISEPLMSALAEGSEKAGLGNVAEGIKAGLAETDAFGDTQDLAVLLDLIGKQEQELYKMIDYSAGTVVAYRDKGFKLEAVGGATSPEVNLTAKHKFGKLADLDGLFIYGASVGNEEYATKALDYLDTIGEVAYLAAKKVTTLEIEDGDFNQFKEGFGMFDQILRNDLVQIWKALRDDIGGGMGAESALLVDLKGGLPTVPGVPSAVIDEATAPRVAFVADVKDRAKLGEGWNKVNGSIENLLKTASQLSGMQIPMQKPMTSEKDDLITYFFSIPAQTENAMLTASLDDNNFYATTSKTFTKELSALLKEGGSDQTGAHLRVNFAPLRDYAKKTLAVIDKNAEEVFANNPGEKEDFQQALPQINEVIEALGDLKDLTVHTRIEGGRPRSSVHFNMN